MLSFLKTPLVPRSTLQIVDHTVVHLGIFRFSHLFELRSEMENCLLI